MAPTPMSPAALAPVKSDATMATTGIMVSGRAVPTAASTLPTAPAPRFSRSPQISIALVNRAAATTIAAAESSNSMMVNIKRPFLGLHCSFCSAASRNRMRGILPTCRDGYTKAMAKFPDDLDRILEGVASGSLSPSAAAQHLRSGEVRYLDEFAVLDVGRLARKGEIGRAHV